SLKQVLTWLLIVVLLVVFMDLLMYALEVEVVPPWSEEVYESTDSLLFLLLALVVLAPLTEEFVFRGFLFQGFLHRMGPVWAVVFSALPWALLHVFQYEWLHLLLILMLGIVLGVARWKTGSLVVPLIMHGFNNFLATLEIVFLSS
ncbi:MAG: CPBP family intramembrane glutamic endopeptidase, partial [bacterium]